MSVKKELSEGLTRKRNLTSSVPRKEVHKNYSSPYLNSLSKNTSMTSIQSPKKNIVSDTSKLRKKGITGNDSTKLLKKGGKQKLVESEKKNILKSIGVEKPKKLQKYLK